MKRLLQLVALASILVMSGCVDADRIHIRFDINPNLKGTATLDFLGIHSTKEKLEEQKSEMRLYLESEYREDASHFERGWSLGNVRTEFSNKTELKCDGRLVGEIDDLIKSLSPLLQEAETTYEIKQDAKRFYFTARGGWDKQDDNILFSIHYSGKIVENNAQKYDESAHLMEWNFGKLDESGVHFVLELEEPEVSNKP